VASHTVRLHPLAADEADGARAWYAARNPTVADAFLLELDAAIANIADGPMRWPRIHGRFRRYLLHKFPFSVVYIERRDFIEVIAVAHHRRKPGYWSQR
jgi:plasmid stabilization system protein ParE